jgi:hypothetical protein
MSRPYIFRDRNNSNAVSTTMENLLFINNPKINIPLLTYITIILFFANITVQNMC